MKAGSPIKPVNVKLAIKNYKRIESEHQDVHPSLPRAHTYKNYKRIESASISRTADFACNCKNYKRIERFAWSELAGSAAAGVAIKNYKRIESHPGSPPSRTAPASSTKTTKELKVSDNNLLEDVNKKCLQKLQKN